MRKFFLSQTPFNQIKYINLANLQQIQQLIPKLKWILPLPRPIKNKRQKFNIRSINSSQNLKHWQCQTNKHNKKPDQRNKTHLFFHIFFSISFSQCLWSTGADTGLGAGTDTGAGLSNWKSKVWVQRSTAIKKLLKIFLFISSIYC